MAQSPAQTVQFDILLKSVGSGQTPNLGNIDRFRVASEDIERCRRWLARRGVDCHATDFSLACSTTVEIFETLFATKLQPGTKAPGTPPWRCAPQPQSPADIQEYVDQITIAAPPEPF